MLLIAQGEQKSQGWEIKRHELTIDEATSEIITTRSLLADSNRDLEQTRQDTQALLELTIQDTQELLNVSNKLIASLQLLLNSSTWRVSKRLIAFMLQPKRLGRGSVLLDEIDHDIEALRQWNTAALNKLDSGLDGYIQKYAPVEPPPAASRQEAELLETNAAEIRRKASLPFAGKTNHPVRIGLVVTEDSDTTSAGDFFTAKELATALKNELGWECIFLPENSESADWYDVSDLDVLLVLLDKYDISRIHSQNKPLLKIAWMRNWVDRWTFRPWFQHFDLVLCTSELARQYVYDHTGKLAYILKIAANIDRFHPSDEVNPDLRSDYCFTGSYWGAPRQIENLDPSKIPYEFALFGAGWEQHDRFADSYRGNLPYDKLPEVYTSTRILVDDANHVTKPWASVNSRVFDALAAGTLVITNGTSGARETFGDLLPTYSTDQELMQQLRYFLDHPDERNRLARELHQLVLQEHCYKTRAQQLAGILRDELSSKARVAIKVPIPHAREAIHWHEFSFAKGLASSLRNMGYSIRLDFMPEWYAETTIPDDVVIVLGGKNRYKPDQSVINLLWMINYPAEPERDTYDDYDQIFVASEQYVEQLCEQTQTPVTPLLLCTDPEVFLFKEPRNRSANVVFVGNSGRKRHPILDDAITAGLKPLVIGTDWDGMIDESLIAGEYIEQDALPEFYTSSGVVLCDHGQDTAGYGFIPSQLFDAIACGAVPVCQSTPGITEIFDDLVYQSSSDPDEISAQVQKALNEDADLRPRRQELAEKIGRDHSFTTRARVIDSAISSIIQSKRTT
jgi:spore maturation protein CgeB